jgi:DNA-binding HxlR family transcriptional regulator
MRTARGSKTVRPIFVGRWTSKILFSLKVRPYRPGQLRHHLGTVSQRMLTRTLRNPESAGLIARRVTRSEDHRCRVFADPTGKDTHRSVERNVPLVAATRQTGECRSTA